jgi:hypothetical protein
VISNSYFANQMFEKFVYLPDIQKWIIGNHVAADTTTLSEYGITTDGAVVFLYLKCQKMPYGADQTYSESTLLHF